MKQPTIISLGGSLIVPDAIDVAFLTRFKKMIEAKVASGMEFIIITGGGKTARRYQSAGKELSVLSSADVDWIGIHALHLNAEFMRIVFGTQAHPSVVTDTADIKTVTAPIVLGGARAPGHSTDYDAVQFAKEAGAKRIINLSNIDYVYDKDPKKYSDAKKIEHITWAEFRKIIPEKWEPGLNSPFDPIGAKTAEALGLEVACLNGANIENLEAYLEGKPFVGTLISVS